MAIYEIELNFWISLVLCLLCLLVFNRMLMRGIKPGLMTVPYIIFSYLYFILAPLVNVLSDKYVDRSIFLSDPVRLMAQLNYANSIGLCFACAGSKILGEKVRVEIKKVLNYPQFFFVCLIILPFSIIYGFYSIFISRNLLEQVDGKLVLDATILNYIMSETAPLIFCWLVTTYFYSARKRPPHMVALCVLSLQLLLILVLNTSRGSRVSILIQLIASGQIYALHMIRFRLVHYVATIGLIALLLPTYAYFKYAGYNALYDYVFEGRNSQVAEYYNDPITFIVGDIGRADIQAPILGGLIDGRLKPNYFGETYLSGILIIIPSAIRPSLFKSKVVLGEAAQRQLGSSPTSYVLLDNGEYGSSRIYGMLGEALLNFGIYAIPIVFFAFGLISRFCFLRVSPVSSWRDALVAPFFALLPVYMLFYDFDNIAFQTVIVWGEPFIIRLVCSRRKLAE